MIVGILQAELFISESSSLKEKRMIIKSFKERVINKFNVSVAEIDYQDKWQRALIAFATVSNKKSHTEEILQKIFQLLDNEFRFELINYKFEYR